MQLILVRNQILKKLAVPNTELFQTESSDVPGFCWSHSPNLEVTAPNIPITLGPHWLFTFYIISSWYFSSFSDSVMEWVVVMFQLQLLAALPVVLLSYISYILSRQVCYFSSIPSFPGSLVLSIYGLFQQYGIFWGCFICYLPYIFNTNIYTCYSF